MEMSSRSSKVEPIEVQEILTGSGALAAKPSPVEHVASPSSPAFSTGSSERMSFQRHSRTMSPASESTASSGLRMNRLSLSFPIQSTGVSSPIRKQSPVREAPSVVPETLDSLTAGPTDSNFLTAIAAQERRVLELKEELSRAEADLTKLKRQWAQHEAQKKRNDSRSVTKLQPLQTPVPPSDKEDDSDGSSAWMQQEMERRKAFLNGNKSSTRTVFSGSRHTRTLSLLSPVRGPSTATSVPRQPRQPPTRKDSLSGSARQSQDSSEPPLSRLAPITRASTTPDLAASQTVAESTTYAEDNLAEQAVDKDVLIQTGKKMATDFRDGLWTFWEDLRQATVGDEATQIAPLGQTQQAQKQPSNQTLKGPAKMQKSTNSLRPSSRGSTTSKTSSSTETAKWPSPSRKQCKVASLSIGSTPALADPTFWSEDGVFAQQASPAPVKKVGSSPRHAKVASPKAPSVDEGEAWDTWDDRSSSSAASESTTLSSTVSGATSPRVSSDAPAKSSRGSRNSDVGKKDPLPWPALSHLGPKALRRTASHLMSEWEKSLTPSPGKEFVGNESGDYLGLGAEAAAAGLAVDRKTD